MVCSSRDYVEAIYIESIEAADIAAVRVPRTELQALEQIEFKVLMGEADDADLRRIRDHGSLVEALDRRSLSLEVVEDA